jgi:hypothetical protein
MSRPFTRLTNHLAFGDDRSRGLALAERSLASAGANRQDSESSDGGNENLGHLEPPLFKDSMVNNCTVGSSGSSAKKPQFTTK